MVKETKQCPYCGKEILAIAKKCKHCDTWLSDEGKPTLQEENKNSQVSVNPAAQNTKRTDCIRKSKEAQKIKTSQEPQEFFNKYRGWIIGVGAILLIFITVIVTLLFSNSSKDSVNSETAQTVTETYENESYANTVSQPHSEQITSDYTTSGNQVVAEQSGHDVPARNLANGTSTVNHSAQGLAPRYVGKIGKYPITMELQSYRSIDSNPYLTARGVYWYGDGKNGKMTLRGYKSFEDDTDGTYELEEFDPKGKRCGEFSLYESYDYNTNTPLLLGSMINAKGTIYDVVLRADF